MLLYSFLGFLLILWLAKLQRDHVREQRNRRDTQQRQRVGLAPIPGANDKPIQDLDAEEQRLLALLRERQEKPGGES
jgi:hypothetical protein